jgi:hypothetical protein
MTSRGEIVKKVVQESGVSVTRVAQEIGISRAQLYVDFSNPEMSYDRIIAIGKFLRHDFSQDFKDIPNGFITLEIGDGSPYEGAVGRQLSECRDKLMTMQEQLIDALQLLDRYKQKYGTDLSA